MSVPILFYGTDDISSTLAAGMLSCNPKMSPVYEVRGKVPSLLSGRGDSVPAVFAERLSALESCDLLVNGPLSSAASLILLYPDLKSKIRRIIFAGGCFRGGNASVCAEQNAFADPEAFDVVLRSGIPVIIAPLECGDPVYLTEEERAALSDSCTYDAALAETIRNSGPIPFRSPAAAGYVLDQTLAETRDLYARIECAGEYCRGSIIPDWRNQYGKPCNVTALMRCDRTAVMNRLIQALQTRGKEAA